MSTSTFGADMAQPTIPEDRVALDALRKLLLEQADAMKDALGPSQSISPRLDVELYERRLADERSRPATLAKLFLLGTPVAIGDATSALDPENIGALAEMGLVELDEDVLRPRARVSSHEGVLVASDVLGGSDPADFVPGPSPSAQRVERLTIRRPVRAALDLGTGSGIQALLTARHSERVVGVDVNERALAFASFNAALNGLTNLDFRAGSWLEPVVGERFDLIVANPPYVVSPDSAFLYRDGELAADAVTQHLLQAVPAHLEEGGFAHVMGNWAYARDDDWRTPLEAWLAGSGCDALLLKYPGGDLVSYAAQWNLLLLAEGREAYLSAVDRWLDYYRREGIETIADGMVVLRRRSGGKNWVRAIEIPAPPTGRAGEQVHRIFEARDRRDELADDETVRATRFAAAPGLRLTKRADRAKVELEAGIGFAAPLPATVAEQIASLDGTRPLGDVIDDAEAAAIARRLFALGLLVGP